MISSPGFVATQERCPRCRGRYLVIFRAAVGTSIRARLVGVVRLTGTNDQGIRAALWSIPEVDPDSVEFMMAVVQRLGRPAEPAKTA